MQQREYQLAGDAPHNHYFASINEQAGEEGQNAKIKEKDDEEENLAKIKEKDEEQNEKLRYSVQERPDDASVANEVVDFVPVDFPSRVREGDTPKPAKEAIAEKSATASEGRGTDAAPSAQLAINSWGNSGRINKLNFSPIDLLGRGAGGENKPGVVQQILSNAIPALDLLPAGDVFSNSTDKFISFVPVEVTRRKVKGGAPRQKLKSKKTTKRKEEELMKLLMAVENMNAAETRATIIAKNREKRRRRKERREREKLKMEKMKMEKMRREKMKENSVLPPDGYHASNSQKNFLKKKYYSRWVTMASKIVSIAGRLKS